MVESAFALAQGLKRFGRTEGDAGVQVVERTGATIVSVAVRDGQSAALNEKFAALLGFTLPEQGKRAGAETVAAVWCAPGQWLVITYVDRDGVNAGALANALAGLASVTDQSDGRVVLEISGPSVRDVLAKGVMLGLHERDFPAGATAVTLIAHTGVQISRLYTPNGFEILVPRSFARSFWDWLEISAAEFGVELT